MATQVDAPRRTRAAGSGTSKTAKRAGAPGAGEVRRALSGREAGAADGVLGGAGAELAGDGDRAVGQHALDAAAGARAEAGGVGAEELGRALAGDRRGAVRVGLARVGVVGALQELGTVRVEQAGQEDAGPAAEAGVLVGRRQLLVRADGGDPRAVDEDGGLRRPVGGVQGEQRGPQFASRSFSSGWAVPPSMATEEMWEATRSSTGSFAGSSWTARCS